MRPIAFALVSGTGNPVPSTRIACLNLFPHLKAAGYEPLVVFGPDRPSEMPDTGALADQVIASGARIAVFQKIHGPSVLDSIAKLRAAGVRVVYCVCDLVDNEMAAATNATIVVTEFLRSLYRPELQHLIHVVHDGIERPDVVRESPISRQDHSALLRAMVVTSHDMYRLPVFDFPPVGWRVDVIGRFPPRDRRRERILAAKWALSKTEDLVSRIATIRAMLHPRIRYFPWGPESVYRDLQQADIGIIPVDTSETAAGACPAPSWKVKSENRLTLMMAMGLPVIATPIPSYEAVMRHGDNGFFARSGAEWTSCFHALSDPGLRKRVGAQARASVVERFSIELQASRFIRVIESLQ